MPAERASEPGTGARPTARVLVLSGLFPRPGDPVAGLFVHRQVSALRELGVHVRVVSPVARQVVPFLGDDAPSELDRPRTTEVEGVPVTYVPYRHVPHRLSTRLEAASLVHSLRSHLAEPPGGTPDLVHGHWLFPAGWAAVEMASEWSVPSVVTAHGSDVHRHPRRNRGTRRFTRRTLGRADRPVAVCRALASRMEELAGRDLPVSVVHSGVDADRFRPASDPGAERRRLGLPARGVGICTVSRLVEEKGAAELLDAFVGLAGRREEVWLAMVGDGPLRGELASIAGREGLSERVFLPGTVPHDEVAGWLRSADLFVLPSHGEGLPVSALEAMACGLPVVASDVGGVPEAVDRRVGRLVPAGDPEALRDRLREMLRDADLRRRLGRAARRRVERAFTWRRSARDLAGVYRDLLQDPGGGRSPPLSRAVRGGQS